MILSRRTIALLAVLSAPFIALCLVAISMHNTWVLGRPKTYIGAYHKLLAMQRDQLAARKEAK